MSTDRLTHASAAAIGRLIAAGTMDAVAVTEHFLDRIEMHPDKSVFIKVTRDRALAEAEASAKRHREGRSLGPLDGVPLTWKDLYDMAGEVTTAGSEVFRHAPAAKHDATVVANLAAAGMVALGKVNLSEFAYSGLGLNPHYGSPRNPRGGAQHHAPGGSSSGSGVSIAAGLAPCSIGSDTGGSVRVPASFNGVTGYKSSEGRIAKDGVFPLSETLDTVGPLARSVEDCVLLDMALRGAVTSDVRRADLSGLTLVIARNVVLDGLDDAVGANFETALSRLSAAGARIERRAMPLLDEVQRVTREHGTITAAEAYAFHHSRVEGPDAQRIDRRVVSRILGGKRMSAYDLLTIQQGRQRWSQSLAADLDGAFLAMPTTAITAPAVAPLEANEELFHATNLKTLRNTMLGNFLGVCALALPFGEDRLGLPTSVMINATGGADEKLLSFGLAIEAALQA
jgi:aspartyl-tRNA(Asn)/glutamyl-tRNA(Gln) amidotransferase subunit A